MTSTQVPNPLRPYYVPPSLGITEGTSNTTATISPFYSRRNDATSRYAAPVSGMFSDIGYNDYVTDASPNLLEGMRKTLDLAFYHYVCVLLSQPFEVAKTILQVRKLDDEKSPTSYRRNERETSLDIDDSLRKYHSDSDHDEPAYFTSTSSSLRSSSNSKSRWARDLEDFSSSPPIPMSPPTPKQQRKLILKKSDSITEAISQEWSEEGVWGVWKGSNATFIYGFLLKTMEDWSRGILLAMFNIPDAGVLGMMGTRAEISDSPYPWALLAVSVTASITAGIVLAPLDLIRTKLMLTPTSLPKRSLIYNFRNLSSYLCPPALLMPTVLHSLITPTFHFSTPLILRTYIAIDPVLTPTAYNFFKGVSQIIELFVRLPLETVLHRAQIALLTSTYARTCNDNDCAPVVPIGPYKGVAGTMWSIMREEGFTTKETGAGFRRRGKKIARRGQGIEGLWRGWRVGMWGLIGMWGARTMGKVSSNGDEF